MSRIKVFILLLISSTLFVGCWDSVEISNRSVILEFAIDKNDEYVPDEATPIGERAFYNVSYSIPDMAKLSGTQGLAEDVKTNIVVQAPTVATSIDTLETKTRNTISLGNVKAVMIGESLLEDRKLFKQAMDSMLRDMLIARNVPILAVKGKASDAVQIQNSQQPIVGLYLMNYFNNKERATGYFKQQLLGEFITNMQDTGIATMPIFSITEEQEKEEPKAEGSDQAKQANPMQGKDTQGDGEGSTTEGPPKGEIEISGAALIKDYDLVGFLSKEEVRGQLLIEGKVKNAPIVVEYKNKPVTYKVVNQKSKIKFEPIEGGKELKCKIDIEAIGNVVEYSSDDNNNTISKEDREAIKKLIEEQLIKEAELAVDKSREYNIDFLGIGQAMYRKHPEEWENYKADWYLTSYKYMPIELDSTVEIKNTGGLK